MDALMLVLADSRFPAGAHAHSLGLEQAVEDGLRAEDVPAFAAARLRLVAEADAKVAVAARRAVARPSGAGLAAIEAEWSARCPSPVLREVGRRLGAQLLRSAAAIWPEVAAYRGPRPVALGVVGAAAGIDDEGVALLALYDDAATVTSAALKLLPLDPAVTTRWLAELAPQMALAARAIAADHRPLADQPGPAAVALELAAPVHHSRRERLFAS